MGGMGKKSNNYILCQNFRHFISCDYSQNLHLAQVPEESAQIQFFIDFIFFIFWNEDQIH